MRIEKRIIVITGASSGIGRGLKEKFESNGDIVIDVSLDGRDYQCDVGNSEKLKAVFEDIYLNHGEIDMLITCAGYGVSGAAELIDDEVAKKQFDVNFFGTTFACKYAIPMLKKDGRIVVIGSAQSIFPLPFKTYYCSSKAAVDSFSQGLRMELSQTKIQVTSICPGDVRTNFTKNRIKVFETNERYGKAIEKSINPSEKSEKKRMPPEYAIKKIYKICNKKHYKPRYIIGKQYKFYNVCKHLFPHSLIMFCTKQMYLKK